MAKIQVKDIKPNGAELFDDSEGFMDELNEDSVGQLKGGSLLPNITDDQPEPTPTFTYLPSPQPYW